MQDRARVVVIGGGIHDALALAGPNSRELLGADIGDEALRFQRIQTTTVAGELRPLRWLRAGGGCLGADPVGGAPTGKDWKLVYLAVEVVEQSLAFADVHPDHAGAGTELDVLILDERRRTAVLDGPIWDRQNGELLG